MKMNGKENSLNYIQARSSQKWRDYKAAMIDFIQKLEDNNGCSVVDKPAIDGYPQISLVRVVYSLKQKQD